MRFSACPWSTGSPRPPSPTRPAAHARPVAGVLQGEDFERLRQEIELELRETARRKLKNHVWRAADGWINAIDTAAAKGDHKPAKDLLLHTGVIDPLGEHGAQGGSLCLVGVRVDSNGNVNAWRETSTGRVYEKSDLRGRSCLYIGMPGFPLPVPTQEEVDAALACQEAARLESIRPKSDTQPT